MITDRPADQRPEGADMLDTALTTAIGAALRRARQARGLTLYDLSPLLPSRTQAPTISGYENGVKKLSLSRMVEISIALDVSPMDILAEALKNAAPELAIPTERDPLVEAQTNINTALGLLHQAQADLRNAHNARRRD